MLEEWEIKIERKEGMKEEMDMLEYKEIFEEKGRGDLRRKIKRYEKKWE